MFLKKYKELLLLIILFTFLLNVFLPDFTEEKILLHILASPAPGMCGPLIGTSLFYVNGCNILILNSTYEGPCIRCAHTSGWCIYIYDQQQIVIN